MSCNTAFNRGLIRDGHLKTFVTLRKQHITRTLLYVHNLLYFRQFQVVAPLVEQPCQDNVIRRGYMGTRAKVKKCTLLYHHLRDA